MPDINDDKQRRDTNPDPITGSPGAHPVGVGIGAAGAGAAGAAIGTAVGGPIGTAVGAAIGAVVGGLAGKGVAEIIDPTAEDAYWRENHGRQEFANHRAYDEYEPAYRTGYEGFGRHYSEGTRFEDAEAKLRADYKARHGDATRAELAAERSRLGWDEARPAAHAAWKRVEQRWTEHRLGGGQTPPPPSQA